MIFGQVIGHALGTAIKNRSGHPLYYFAILGVGFLPWTLPRQLRRVDNGAIRTAPNCGGTLYHSQKTGKFYFVITSRKNRVEQYELADDGTGKVGGRKVRNWQLAGPLVPMARRDAAPQWQRLADPAGFIEDDEPDEEGDASDLRRSLGMFEAAVADDETGKLYVGEDRRGVWEVGAEPSDPTPGELIIKVGRNGLHGDIEGMALYDLPNGDDYLIVSNQENNNFKVYQRSAPHRFMGTFAVIGATRTVGLDVCNANLGARFPKGIFVCHSSGAGRPVLVAPWQDIAKSMGEHELSINTEWHLRDLTQNPVAGKEIQNLRIRR